MFLSSQPNDLQFIWQLDIQLHNFRTLGLLAKHDYHITVWNNTKRAGGKMFAKEWMDLQLKYRSTRAKFYFYNEDKGSLSDCIVKFGYPSLVRPWVLSNHFSKYPELKDKAIFYTDQDVLFTKYPHFLDGLKDDDINYLSETRHYIAASYFDSKVRDVKPEMLEQYKTIDPLQMCMNEVGLNRSVADENELNSGGAQYLLKNIDAKFWYDVFKACIDVKGVLRGINAVYFESEDKGFQSWCADMWAVLWNLWKRDAKTLCPPEMNFAWATDLIEKIDQVYLFHNAGVTPDSVKHKDKFHKLFYKGVADYVNNVKTPFEHEHDYVSREFCSAFYVDVIEEVKEYRKLDHKFVT